MYISYSVSNKLTHFDIAIHKLLNVTDIIVAM